MPRRSLVLAAGLLLIVVALLPTALRKMPDFEVYWRAGRRAIAAEPLYRPEDGHYQLKYLPAFALLVAPVAMLPLAAAKGVWLLATLLAMGMLVRDSLRMAQRGRLPTRIVALLVLLAMLKFFLHELTLGQSNALMAWLLVLAVSLLRSGREVPAGLLVALAVIVKPYAAAFVPYLALRRRWRALGVSITGVLVSLAAPAAIYGWTGSAALLRSWFDTVSASTPANLLGQDNVSIWAMYAKWLGVGSAAFWLATITVGAVAALFLLIVRRGRASVDGDYLEMAALLILMPLCSPQGWDYVLLVSTPAVVLVINRFGDMPPAVRAASVVAVVVMAFSVFDLMGRQAYAQFMALSTITICALVLFAALASMRWKAIA